MNSVVMVDVDNVLASYVVDDGASLPELLASLADQIGDQVRFLLVATDRDAESSALLAEIASAVDAELVLVPRRPRGSHTDVELAVCAVGALSDAETLVLMSGDSDFVAVLEEARRSGVRTIVVAPPTRTAVRLALAADECIDATDLRVALQQLVTPGDSTAGRSLMARFTSASHEIALIDPYVGRETIRLLAWVRPSVQTVVIGTTIDSEARSDVQAMREGGRQIRLVRAGRIHDRWFRIDGSWWHSGGSLKDLGRKYSRISAIEAPSEVAAHEAMLSTLLSVAEAVSE